MKTVHSIIYSAIFRKHYLKIQEKLTFGFTVPLFAERDHRIHSATATYARKRVKK